MVMFARVGTGESAHRAGWRFVGLNATSLRHIDEAPVATPSPAVARPMLAITAPRSSHRRETIVREVCGFGANCAVHNSRILDEATD